ncbi:MAG TPA: thioredoxin family protein, partial [Candidatus Saccharimonadales bacterium]|nr:thioredoxin family protein [Candidatus Saccharimonadales bacterium]
MHKMRSGSILAVLAVAAAAFLAAGVAGAGEGSDASFMGKQAPSFTLTDAHGAKHSLADLEGQKGTVIIWVSTQCPVSNAYNGRMAALAAAYTPKGFNFVGINSNKAEDPAMIASHAKEHGLDFPILKDEGNVVADEYGASVTPEAYVLDPHGVLLYHGRIDDSQKESGITSKDLASALDAILDGK